MIFSFSYYNWVQYNGHILFKEIQTITNEYHWCRISPVNLQINKKIKLIHVSRISRVTQSKFVHILNFIIKFNYF